MDKMSSNAQASVSKPNVTLNNEKSKQQQDNGLHSQRVYRNWNKKRELCNYPRPERKAVAVPKKLPMERRGRQKGLELGYWDYHLNVESDRSGCVDSKHYSSKKHNLNHLLNFSFTPRETHESHCNLKFSKNNSKYSKGRFLQANCQFIVKQGNDYSKHKVDADLPVDWDLVEEVRFNSLTSESIVCPICLHTPVAAKITKCGHIYCWSCILHYLALSDQSFRKCPICFDAIYRQELRSVLPVTRKDFKVGDEIVMCLMRRKKGSTISGPAPEKYESELLSIDGKDVVASYQKLLVASPSQVLRWIIFREKVQLENQMTEEGSTPEACFIESALHNLKEREAAMIIAATALEDEKLGASSSFSPPSDVEHDLKLVEKDDYHYFYQSSDGQHIYLHSLNVRMLCNEYGCWEECPKQVKARIVEMEWASMNDERRKRHRYIQHLPLSCEYRVAELQLEPPTVSDRTFAAFKAEIAQREKERKRRMRDENRRDKHLRVEQQKKIHGIYPLPRYQLNNLHHFPVCSNDSSASPPSPTISDVSLTEENEVTADRESYTHGKFPSFASMLKDGRARSSQQKLNVAVDRKQEVLAVEDEEYCAKPTHQYSLCDAFEAALTMKDSKRKKKSKK